MLEKHIALVKGQISYYDHLIKRFPPADPRYRPQQIEMYTRLYEQHRDLLDYLEEQQHNHKYAFSQEPFSTISPPPSTKIDTPPVDEDDLSDLPEELLAQLSDRTKKGQTDPLIQIINDRGGTATLDEILIDLYRKHKEIGARNIIANKLYRLGKQGFVKSVEGRKGIYTTA